MTTRVIPLRGKPQIIEPWTGAGGHGGGDDVMLAEVFGSAEPDKYLRRADERAGLYSCLIGASANKSFVSGGAVKIADLVHGPDLAGGRAHADARSAGAHADEGLQGKWGQSPIASTIGGAVPI